MSMQKKFILVDGSSYLYRAFHALPMLTNSKKFPTGAIYGMISMLKKLLTDYEPEYMAVVFDAKGETFRDQLYPEYKATRSAMPEELALQIAPLHHIIEALGLPLVMIEGIEADDIIGTLATKAAKIGHPVLISTGDKDLAQLVNDHIHLINTMTNVTFDRAGVMEKFSVPPEKIVDYLSLVGDTSDNIKGIPQVGPKTAVKWLQTYGSLEEIIKNADKVSGKVGESLRENMHQLPLIRTLVTIQLNVALPFECTQLACRPPDHQTLIEFYKEMEFRNYLSELLTTKEVSATKAAKNYFTVMTENELEPLIEKLKTRDCFFMETQTNNRDEMHATVVGIALSVKPYESYYIPFGHDYEDAPKQLSKEYVWERLKPIFEDPLIKKGGDHLKYDMKVLKRYGIELSGLAFDSILESYVLDSASNQHDLAALSLKYLGEKLLTLEEVVGKGKNRLTFNQISIEKASLCAAETADISFRLHEKFWPKIAENTELKYIFTEIEMPLLCVLADMELFGVLIDATKLEKQREELQERLNQLEKEVYEAAGTTFNLNSPKQLQDILFATLGLPVLQKTSKGQPSTADAVLQELALTFALPSLIIEHRALSKLISTYTTKLIEQIHTQTGRVHTFYRQTGTATGRLSSSDPNLQNIPIRSPEGRRIRQAFVAASHCKLVSADYSQIELRLMAHISEDPGLLEAFTQHLDIHKATAAEVWNVSLEEVTGEMRYAAKAINFGLIYGMSAFGLMKQLGVDRKAAQMYIDKYFARYPKVLDYMDRTKKEAKEQGYVKTLFGRRLYIPDINSSQAVRQKAAERMAINAPLQGSAADMIKRAMIDIHHWLKSLNLNAHMIMQVHDELVFEIDEKWVDELIPQIITKMQNPLTLKVPIEVSVGVGDNWDAASHNDL